MNKEQYAQYLANTIIGQLGGQDFIDLTGATGFQYIEKCRGALGMQIKTKIGRPTHVLITLNKGDLYNVMYLRRVGDDVITIGYSTDLYWQQLRQNFEDNTGLITTLYQ